MFNMGEWHLPSRPFQRLSNVATTIQPDTETAVARPPGSSASGQTAPDTAARKPVD